MLQKICSSLSHINVVELLATDILDAWESVPQDFVKTLIDLTNASLKKHFGRAHL